MLIKTLMIADNYKSRRLLPASTKIYTYLYSVLFGVKSQANNMYFIAQRAS
jgi:hypothetical protein